MLRPCPRSLPRLTYIRAAVAKCGGETVVKNFGGYVDHYHKAGWGTSSAWPWEGCRVVL